MYGPLSYHTLGTSYPRVFLRGMYQGYYPVSPGTLPYHSHGFNAGVFEATDAGVARVTPKATAIIICTSPQPAAHAGEQFINVEVWDWALDDKFYVYPCCDDFDKLGKVEVEFHCTAYPSTWTVTIGAENKSYTVNINYVPGHYWTWLYVCADDVAKMVKAYPYNTGGEPVWNDDTDPGHGRYAGLGHDAAGGFSFENFVFGELRTGATGENVPPNKECSDCFCWCWDYAPTKELHISAFAATGRAACIATKSCHLIWEWNAGISRWRGSMTVPQVDGTGSHTFNWCLACAAGDDRDPDWPGRNFTLSECPGTGCFPTWSIPLQPIAELSSCDPLELVFGPFQVTWSVLTCFLCYDPTEPDCDPGSFPPGDPDQPECDGEFYLMVTE